MPLRVGKPYGTSKTIGKDSFMEKRLNLTEEWDKTFPKSEK